MPWTNPCSPRATRRKQLSPLGDRLHDHGDGGRDGTMHPAKPAKPATGTFSIGTAALFTMR